MANKSLRVYKGFQLESEFKKCFGNLTGVHLAVLVAGTHEDLWDDLVPSGLEEHALALLVAEDRDGDVLQDGRKDSTFTQSAPPGCGGGG